MKTLPLLVAALALSSAACGCRSQPTRSAAPARSPGLATPRDAPRETSTPPAAEAAPAPGGLGAVQAIGHVLLATGAPGPEDLEALRAAGVRAVLDLRTPAEAAGFDEAGAARALGLEHVAVPLARPDQLAREDLERALSVLDDVSRRPLLVHAAGGDPVGALWLAYRVRTGDLEWDAALAEAEAVGLRDRAYVERIRELVAGGDER